MKEIQNTIEWSRLIGERPHTASPSKEDKQGGRPCGFREKRADEK